MNPVFNIQTPGIDYSSAHLFLEVGPMGVSFTVLDNSNCFSAMVIYALTQKPGQDSLVEQLDEIISGENLLQANYKRTDIIWSFRQSILVPPDYMDKTLEAEMLDLVYGDAGSWQIQTDFLYKHNLHNLYRIPSGVSDSLSRHFPKAVQVQQYSLLPDLLAGSGDILKVVFYSSCFTVVYMKEGKLQLIRNFDFEHPTDALFHLLNICEQSGAKASETLLQLSGMVTRDSSLYTELFKYFLNIQFDRLPETSSYINAIKDQPPHYFSHLFALAAIRFYTVLLGIVGRNDTKIFFG